MASRWSRKGHDLLYCQLLRLCRPLSCHFVWMFQLRVSACSPQALAIVRTLGAESQGSEEGELVNPQAAVVSTSDGVYVLALCRYLLPQGNLSLSLL